MPRTSVISIRFHSDSRDEAARVANEIARVYLRSGEPAVARILNPARPQAEPVRPNKRIGITVGVAVSAVLGVVGSFLVVVGVKRSAASA